MITPDGEWVACDETGCPARHKNHRWGSTKASGWFHARDGQAYCPTHVPEWVAAWRDSKRGSNPKETSDE